MCESVCVCVCACVRAPPVEGARRVKSEYSDRWNVMAAAAAGERLVSMKGSSCSEPTWTPPNWNSA